MFPGSLAGTWEGQYSCDGKQFTIQAILALQNGDQYSLEGRLTFLNDTVKGVEIVTVVESSEGNVLFSPVRWETDPPSGVALLGLTGKFDSVLDQITGTTTIQECQTFSLSRVEGWCVINWGSKHGTRESQDQFIFCDY